MSVASRRASNPATASSYEGFKFAYFDVQVLSLLVCSFVLIAPLARQPGRTHTSVCSGEDHNKKRHSKDNFTCHAKKLKSSGKGTGAQQVEGEGKNQGDPIHHEPTNKQKQPPLTEAAEGRGHERKAQPPEPAQIEVRKLMEARRGVATAQGEEDEQGWKKVGKRCHF